MNAPSNNIDQAVRLFGEKGRASDPAILERIAGSQARPFSFLLILDAKTFKELARAVMTHIIPPGLHGQYFIHEK